MASQSSIRGGRQLASQLNSSPLTENFRLTQGPQIVTADQHFNITSDFRLSLRRSVSCAATTSKSMAADRVQRWSGMTRTVGDWDGLRRVS